MGEAERAWEAEQNLPRLPQSAELFSRSPPPGAGHRRGTTAPGRGAAAIISISKSRIRSRPRRATGRYLHSASPCPCPPRLWRWLEAAGPVPEDEAFSAGPGSISTSRGSPFMLVSAYLATCNSEAVDRRLFGHMVEGRRAGTSAVGTGGGKPPARRAQRRSAAGGCGVRGARGTARVLARAVAGVLSHGDEAVVRRGGRRERGLGAGAAEPDVFMQISSAVRWVCCRGLGARIRWRARGTGATSGTIWRRRSRRTCGST